MPQVNSLVQLHKQSVKGLIYNSDISLLIRLPAPIVSTGVNVLYGQPQRETLSTGDTKGPFKCLWYDALTAKTKGDNGVETTISQLAGQYREADTFAEVWLQDVLVDTTDPYGLTWFDKARWVIIGNKRYKFLGSAKLGLATSAPYFLMIALQGAVGYADS